MKAAVYLRISSDPSGQQLGVTRQREDCEKLCQGKGWTPVEYMDNDISASNGKKRPAYRAAAHRYRSAPSAPSSPGTSTGCIAAPSSWSGSWNSPTPTG